MRLYQPPQQVISFDNRPRETDAEFAWVKKLDPDKRLLKGNTYLIAKRVFDLILTLLSAPVWLPFFLLISALIKISSPKSPVFFTQMRTGYSGHRFRIYKFRTMVPDADDLKKEYLHLNELQWPDFKISDDPRVTSIGRFLRKSSLDELPQIINILKGEMSWVGPRPTSFGPETYKLWHTERLDVVPGLTGLWQVYGRASTEFDDRLRLDIIYIEHRSMWLDILILFFTVTAVLNQRGAH